MSDSRRVMLLMKASEESGTRGGPYRSRGCVGEWVKGSVCYGWGRSITLSIYPDGKDKVEYEREQGRKERCNLLERACPVSQRGWPPVGRVFPTLVLLYTTSHSTLVAERILI